MNDDDIRRMNEYFATNHFDKEVEWQGNEEAAADPDDSPAPARTPMPLPAKQ
jgi:hypothetical protein